MITIEQFVQYAFGENLTFGLGDARSIQIVIKAQWHFTPDSLSPKLIVVWATNHPMDTGLKSVISKHCAKVVDGPWVEYNGAAWRGTWVETTTYPTTQPLGPIVKEMASIITKICNAKAEPYQVSGGNGSSTALKFYF